MKVLAILSAILVVSCAQDAIENFKLNWPKVHELERNPLEPRIAGGAISMPHEFPYQIGLYMQHREQPAGDGKIFSLCGASLVSDRVVITAAHCLIKSDVGVVFAGSHDLFGESDHQLIGVSMLNWVVHPDYDHAYSKNDIAVIKLPRAVKLSSKVQKINLPRRSQKYSDIEGQLATVSGWGRTGDDEPTSELLRFANVKILPESVCRTYYSVLFTKTNVCVDGSRMKSVCSGDSGGPLAVTEHDGSKTLVGLTSYGNRHGCQLGYPTVFTRVSAYLDWISSETGLKVRD